MISEVRVFEAEPRPVAAVRRQATPDTISGLITGSPVWTLVREAKLENTGINIVIYWDQQDGQLFAPGGIPVDIGVELKAPFASTGELISTATPGGLVATCRHTGSYDGLGKAYRKIRDYCGLNALALAGPYWEIYGHWTDDVEKLQTDVFYLLAPGPTA